MEYSFSVGRDENVMLGLHPRKQFGRVFDLKECYLQSSESAEIVVAIRNAASNLSFPAYDIKKHTGLLRYCVVREGKNTNQRMLNIVTSSSAETKVRELTEKAFFRLDDFNSIVNNINTKKANIAYGEYENLIHGQPYITESVNEINYKISANSFFQTNTLTSKHLFDTIIDYTDCDGTQNILDLYCGTGSISFSLSRKSKKITGVDSESSAIEDAIANRELNSITNCEFFVADSLNYLDVAVASGSKFEIIVADPPRAGMHPKMIPLLAKIRPLKFIYVSCNPAALARDCQMLIESGFELVDITSIDMFPQTPHVEAVALLRSTYYD
jgi:23S rRNA (uracil1939-C5)-methyltransferase